MATVLLPIILGAGVILIYYLSASKGQQRERDEEQEQQKRRAPGLTQLWPGDRDIKGATIDIIAIHGLGTQSPDTWTTYRNRTDSTNGYTNWLRDADMLHAKFPKARIYTYDWLSMTYTDAVQDGLRGHAETFLDELKNRDSPGRHVILIASCFGGLLLAKAMTLALNKQYGNCGLLEHTAGILFLGTPFRKSDAGDAALVRVRVAKAMGGEASDDLIKYLIKHNNALSEVVEDFERIVKIHDTRLICYYETKPTQIYNAIFPRWIANLFASGNFILVPRESVSIAGSKLRPMGVKHSLLNKFSGTEDKNFQAVCKDLQEFLDQAEQSDIHRVLEDYYKYNDGQRLHIERLSGDRLPMEKCYINLCIVEHTRDHDARANRSPNDRPSEFSLLSRLKVETPPKTKQVTLDKLFESRRRSDGRIAPSNRVLIWGRAGAGKSTLCKKILYDFVYKGLWNDLFDHVFWFPLRELKLEGMRSDNLEDMILRKFSGTTNNDPLRTQLRTISPHRTLFILDGLDEVSHVLDPETSVGMGRILNELLQRENVIITSRPHSTRVLRDTPLDLELETIGFFPAQVDEYLDFVGEQQPAIVFAIRSFIQRHPVVQNLVRIPIQLDAICFCWESKYMPSDTITMTILYQKIESRLWEKYLIERDKLEKSQIENLITRPFVKNEINFLGKLAFDGLYNEIIEFGVEHIGNTGIGQDSIHNDKLVHMQFLRSSDISLKSHERTYHFIHLTFQEYFAAQYFVSQWMSKGKVVVPWVSREQCPVYKEEQTSAEDFLRREKYNARYDIFWRFVVGSLQQQGVKYLQQYFEVVESEPLDLLGPVHQRLIVHCLNEVCLSDGQFGLQTRLVQEYQEWVSFEDRLVSEKTLASEIECPDRIFVSLLQGTDKTIQIALSSLCRRPSISPMLLDLILDMFEKNLLDGENKTMAFRVFGLNSHRTSEQRIFDFWQGLHRLKVSDRLAAVESMQYEQPQDLALEALVRLVEDDDSDVRFLAASTVAQYSQLPETITKTFLRLLVNRGEDVEVRVKALDFLTDQSQLLETSVAVVAQILEEEDSETSYSVSATFENKSQLLRMMLKNSMQLLKNRDEDIDFRRMIVRRLTLESPFLESVSQSLVQSLNDKDEDPEIREVVALTLGEQTELPETVVTTLTQILDDEDSDPEAWCLAVNAFFGQRPLPEKVIGTLIRLLEDESIDSRARYLGARAFLGQNQSSEAAVVLVSLLKDKNYQVRNAAECALGRNSQLPESAVMALESLLKHKRRKVRYAATQSLTRQSQLPESTVVALVHLLHDECTDVRSFATEVLTVQDQLPETALVAIVQCLGQGNFPETVFMRMFIGQLKQFPQSTLRPLLSRLQGFRLDQTIFETCCGREEFYQLVPSLDAALTQVLLTLWLADAFVESKVCYIVEESIHIKADQKPATTIFLGRDQLEIFKCAVRGMREELGVPPFARSAQSVSCSVSYPSSSVVACNT